MKTPFPSVYSTLCPLALASLIADTYQMSEVSCQLLVKGVGDTYLVVSSNGRFVFRVYRFAHRSLAQIEEEANLLMTLKLAKVAVAYPLPDRSGAVVQQINAVEGQRHAILFSFAPGHAVKILDKEQLRSFGNEMAHFHQVSAGMGSGTQRWKFDTDTTLSRPLELIKPFFTEDPDGYAWLRSAADQVREKLARTDISGFSIGYCHFDFLPKNLHFEGNAVTFFDFDFMGYGLLANDLGSFWQHLMLEVYAGRMTQQAADESFGLLIDGYRECRPISEQELAVIPYLALGFWLFYMGFHTTHDQFAAFTQPATLKAYTGFLRYMAETYWK